MLAIIALPLTVSNGIENFSLALSVLVSDISKFLGNDFCVAIELQKTL